MTFSVESPMAVLALLVIIIELAAVALFLWWRLRRLDNECDELVEQADMQGDALREALTEIDRYRRLHRRGG